MWRESGLLPFIGTVALITGMAATTACPAQEPSSPPRIASGILKDGRLVVAIGDRVTVHLGEDLRPVVDAVIPAPENSDDPGQHSSPPGGPITFTLKANPSGGTILLVHSAYSKPLRYHARIGIVREGKSMSAPTSTCPVLTGLMVFESWPEPIVAIIVTSFEENANGDTACHN